MSDIYITPVGLGVPKRVIETVAERVALMFEYDAGGSLDEVVANHGGEIVFGSTGQEDYKSGSIIARDMTDYTIYLSQNTSRLRDRFTIAHELGHLVLHLPKIKEANHDAVMRATRWVDDTNPDQRRAEIEANWFAAAFLMPADQFSAAYRQHDPDYVKDMFDVSRAAVDTRARTLGL